jgi:UDP-N-acetylglucosamine--N-acetylmuramyl-(pentapeptide) pyrophosphoryl-undecaprenol N-acetylglucosamine transferase
VIAAGGTAGHVYPGLALAERLRGRGGDVLFVGRDEGQEAHLVPDAGFRLATVEARPFIRKVSIGALRAPFAAVRAASRVRSLLGDVDVAVGMGGYTSVPLALAALRTRTPLVLHEQNAVPGLANRVAARWARAIALNFPEAADRLSRRARTVVTGNPIREAIARVRRDRVELAEEAVRELDLEPSRRTVVAFGGSQGALRLNRAVVGALPLLAERDDLQVVLLTGTRHGGDVARHVPRDTALLVRTRPFLERMELAYAAADLVVSRSGAGTIAEISACGLPCLLVPYPHATGRHQEANARALVRAGGASLLMDDQLDPETLAERLDALLDAERLSAMAKMSEAFGHPNAADALADLVMETA